MKTLLFLFDGGFTLSKKQSLPSGLYPIVFVVE